MAKITGYASIEGRNRKLELENQRFSGVKDKHWNLGRKRMERRVIYGYHEEILARLDHFCGIYGALSSGRLSSDRQ